MAARRYYIDREHSKRNELKESFTIVELENIAQAARVIFERSFVLDDGDVTGCTGKYDVQNICEAIYDKRLVFLRPRQITPALIARCKRFASLLVLTAFFYIPIPRSEYFKILIILIWVLNDWKKDDKIRTCYLYTYYCYVNEIEVANAVLRERFGVEEKNKAIISRIIKDTIDAGFIKLSDENVAPKLRRYIPYWA